ncbi:RNA pyrophosphohydrolase [Piscirickettsia salmonis]|uniref:RNA pyrophosphohydrolase n=1 Tax=Piscirickettsia salmonis TaxID=1238 RepID=UPI0007C96855|nr:RNA pyrophosphohydrolase [Piscirickettsiaceae bacterium NZ-RLO1]
MIDEEGFRANVGIVLCNAHGQLFWGRRIGQSSWQFPQGGIAAGETVEEALFRELEEEVGLTVKDVKILAATRGWLRYRLPPQMVRRGVEPICIGQKQRWYLLRLLVEDECIDLAHSGQPEFDGWKWVSYWHPLQEVVSFKKRVYRRVLQYFLPAVSMAELQHFHSMK